MHRHRRSAAPPAGVRGAGRSPSPGLLLAGSILLLAGCTQTPAWGKKATALPGWGRIKQAAISAAVDTQTWAPLAGAALLQIGDLDAEIADWAARETPLFGSHGAADGASDAFRDMTKVGWAVSLAATPSGRSPGTALCGKAKGLVVEGAALWLQGFITTELKDATGRERPDGSGTDSFPSGHTSTAAGFSALGRRHVDALPLCYRDKVILESGFTALTALTAWSRVEANRHYPSDVLVGWSLANFVTLFMHDAFIGRSRGDPRLVVGPSPQGLAVNLTIEP